MVTKIIALCALLAAFFGAYSYIDSSYVRVSMYNVQAEETKARQGIMAEEMKAQKRNHDYQFLQIQWKGLKNAIWDLKQRFIGRPMDTSSSKLLHEWETEKEEIETEMRILEKGK